MSIVFAIILGLYAAMRVGLWMQGQCQLRLSAKDLPALPPKSSPPEHLRPELARFFEHCSWANLELSQQRRQIAKARMCDPDKVYGFLRDPRYRRAVLESARVLRDWQGRTENFYGGPKRRTHAWPVSHECAQSTLLAMEPQLRSVSRARALEPFSLQDVEGIDRALRSFMRKLEQTLQDLEGSQATGYRQAAANGPYEKVWAQAEPV